MEFCREDFVATLNKLFSIPQMISGRPLSSVMGKTRIILAHFYPALHCIYLKAPVIFSSDYIYDVPFTFYVTPKLAIFDDLPYPLCYGFGLNSD